MADFFWFSDSQWARIEPHLPMDVRGKKRVDDRRVLSGSSTRSNAAGAGRIAPMCQRRNKSRPAGRRKTRPV